MDCARCRIVRAVYHAFHAGMHQGARAHGTRLNCNKQLAVSQAVITQVCSGLAKGDDFGVSGGIEIGDIAIPASTDDLSRVDDDRAYGDLARFQCALGRAEGFFHPELVGGRWLFVVSH